MGVKVNPVGPTANRHNSNNAFYFDVSERNDFKLDSLLAQAGRVGPGYGGRKPTMADRFDELAIPRSGGSLLLFLILKSII